MMIAGKYWVLIHMLEKAQRPSKADSQSKAPAVAVRVQDSVKNETIETDQTVNVYLFYAYEKLEITGLIQSVPIVIAATLTLYLSTYVVARIIPKWA